MEVLNLWNKLLNKNFLTIKLITDEKYKKNSCYKIIDCTGITYENINACRLYTNIHTIINNVFHYNDSYYGDNIIYILTKENILLIKDMKKIKYSILNLNNYINNKIYLNNKTCFLKYYIGYFYKNKKLLIFGG